MIVRFIARLFQIAFAYCVAAVAAGATFAAAFAVLVSGGLSLVETAFFGIPLGLLFAFIAVAPAIIAIILGELLRLQSWIFYAIAGALIAIGSWSLFEGPLFREIMVEFSWLSEQLIFRETRQDMRDAFRQVTDGSGALLVIAATGLAGGLAYWLLAGNTAGNVIRVPGDPNNDEGN